MYSVAIIGFLGCFIVALSFGLWLKSRNHRQVQAEFEALKAELSKSVNVQEQLQQLETEKQKFEQKNKKLWKMSETVHKEKAKVDTLNENLQLEKDKLEADKKKLDEKVKKLWQTSTSIHKEKERINELKNEIEEKHQSIMDSVNYAQRIQAAILPTQEEIKMALPHSFVLFKPRDIVSGDFYWFSHFDSYTVIACCDCTGHGVPGAFMSMIGNTLLNQIVNENGISDASQILFQLDLEINQALKQSSESDESGNNYNKANDGMDVGLCVITNHPDGNKTLNYSGANRPLYFISGGEFTEQKATVAGIGGINYGNGEKSYLQYRIPLLPGDTFYISSDGYADQFSELNQKLMTKRFKEELRNIQHLNMDEQCTYLGNYLDTWKGKSRQMDDVCVIGIRV